MTTAEQNSEDSTAAPAVGISLDRQVRAQDAEVDDACMKPCDPDVGCEHCAGYWERMEVEGFWDGPHHRWTDKGWREIIK